MPELPEVETIRNTLKQVVLNKEIETVEISYPKIIKKPDDVHQFADALRGEVIKDIGRRGKFLLFYTTNYTLVSHLRMEGKYGLFQKSDPVDKHSHVFFKFTDETEMRYTDVRKFGTMHLFKKGTEESSLPLSHLGPEPFSEQFTVAHLKEMLGKTRRRVKTALLDQRLLVGLGNIYVDEVLFRSNVHPETPSNLLTENEITIIHKEIKATLKEAIDKGGSTIRSYVSSDGEMGMFQLELYVYGRNGEQCNNCRTTIEKITVNGRGTHYCPNCQIKNSKTVEDYA